MAPRHGWAGRRMAGEALLQVTGLRAGYGAIEVLRGVDLELRTGEIVALLGSNGAGKSTLNNNLSGLYRPLAGSIRFAGAEIAGAATTAEYPNMAVDQ